jgi:hypothetical protein
MSLRWPWRRRCHVVPPEVDEARRLKVSGEARLVEAQRERRDAAVVSGKLSSQLRRNGFGELMRASMEGR